MMNDFTKEELKYLLAALNGLHANYMPHLEPKMQYMIDNYCEHERCEHERDEDSPSILSHFTTEKGCIFLYKCKNCGEFYR